MSPDQLQRTVTVREQLTVAIMQPYFLPYIGYFQLIAASDKFIVYDNIKYTKRGWINRNRLLQGGEAAGFTIPIEADSDYRQVWERKIAADFRPEKLLARIDGCYRRAPYFNMVFPLIESIVQYPDRNLFGYLTNSIRRVCEYLGIDTEIKVASTIMADHQLRGQERVLAICKSLQADRYLNAIGGTELYSREEFDAQGVELRFLRSRPIEYPQFDGAFVPWLSIVDVMMFNSKQGISSMLFDRDLI